MVNEIFELTIDGNIPENTPEGMIKNCKYCGFELEKWSHEGPTITGKKTKKFKLTQIGQQHDWTTTKTLLRNKNGPTPEGQWLKAFKEAYPKSDYKGPIVVADASWIGLLDGKYFPYLSEGGLLVFSWVGASFGDRWRWLVFAL
ncbi:MAG: hypothetical protein WCX70_00530 [Candidatus Paceibacterota bacterium]